MTTQRQNKVASSNRSTTGEINFGDLGYEVTTRHEDHTKAESGIVKELHVLKQQIWEEPGLHRQENELQQEHV